MTASRGHALGRAAYEADVADYPHYPDGTPRRTWDQLSEIARWSWERDPTPTTASRGETGA